MPHTSSMTTNARAAQGTASAAASAGMVLAASFGHNLDAAGLTLPALAGWPSPYSAPLGHRLNRG